MIKLLRILTLLAVTLSLSISTLFAGDAEVTFVSIKKSNSNWHFSVTLKHADTGWEHYTNAWRVVDKNGKVLGTRILYHPHVDEQPFTRSHSIKISDKLKEIYVEARDSKHGWNKVKVKIDLTKNKGPQYEIK